MPETQAASSNDPKEESSEQADTLKDQLRRDVAVWSAARAGHGPNPDGRPNAPPTKPSAPTPARASRAKPKPVVQPAPVEKKPFRMSYDGTTDQDYIAHRISLGAR